MTTAFSRHLLHSCRHCLDLRATTQVCSQGRIRSLASSALRRHQAGLFLTVAPHSESRTAIESALKHFKDALSKRECEVHAVGAFRRGIEAEVLEMPVLVVGRADDRLPLTPHDQYSQEESDLMSLLARDGLVTDPSKTLKGDRRISVSVNYVPRACEGAALLCLTGDDSYVRFLKLLAIESMGLYFNKLGLWKSPRHDRSSAASNGSQVAKNSKTEGQPLPSGIVIESAEGSKESAGARRMRETRKAMGLPEGLDLSLDLGPTSDRPVEEVSIDELHASLQEAIEASGAESETEKMEYAPARSSSEAGILDMLGLVWIPPSMRTVKEP